MLSRAARAARAGFYGFRNRDARTLGQSFPPCVVITIERNGQLDLLYICYVVDRTTNLCYCKDETGCDTKSSGPRHSQPKRLKSLSGEVRQFRPLSIQAWIDP